MKIYIDSSTSSTAVEFVLHERVVERFRSAGLYALLDELGSLNYQELEPALLRLPIRERIPARRLIESLLPAKALVTEAAAALDSFYRASFLIPPEERRTMEVQCGFLMRRLGGLDAPLISRAAVLIHRQLFEPAVTSV